MAGSILVKPGKTITVVGIPADAPLPPYIPGPVDPGYSPPWAQIPPEGLSGTVRLGRRYLRVDRAVAQWIRVTVRRGRILHRRVLAGRLFRVGVVVCRVAVVFLVRVDR